MRRKSGAGVSFTKYYIPAFGRKSYAVCEVSWQHEEMGNSKWHYGDTVEWNQV